MHDLWPETKFVHLIRDGRDVCLSMMNWKGRQLRRPFSAWKEDRVSTGALWWELNVRLGRQDGGSLAPELYHEVHYEALVSEPEETCAISATSWDCPTTTPCFVSTRGAR